MKVFWSWQSDTPGKTGRFFVRDCLLAAIEEIKQHNDIVEPTERETRDSVHLDSDRQGVPGSPDLANLIFQKIDASEVFIADVTPVSRISARKRPDGSRSVRKLNMNPNVAIELGYALKSRGSENVLMILNEHYGKRQSLPFDLAHKAGPLIYVLKPDASKEDQRSCAALLTAKLVDALELYVGRAQSKPQTLEGILPTASEALYFDTTQPLVLAARHGEDDERRFYEEAAGFYLRVIPQYLAEFSRAELEEKIAGHVIRPLSDDHADHTRKNEYGLIAFDLNPEKPREIESIGQVFRSGEAWGISRRLLRTLHRDTAVPSMAVERAYRATLRNYITLVRDCLKLQPPYLIKAGAVGLKGKPFVYKGHWGGSERRPFLTDGFHDTQMFESGEAPEPEKFLIRLFNKMWDEVGLTRPANYTE